MATRCTIKIEGVEFAKVYKHWDGYPSGTLQWLEEFNRDFADARGGDASYKFAQLLRHSAFECQTYNLDDSRHTGWGVVSHGSSCGEEFEYTLHLSGTVTYIQI